MQRRLRFDNRFFVPINEDWFGCFLEIEALVIFSVDSGACSNRALDASNRYLVARVGLNEHLINVANFLIPEVFDFCSFISETL